MTDEIDERRAKALYESMHSGAWQSLWGDLDYRHQDEYRRRARAIRLSDEAAGYILIKHEGIISSEGMKPVEGA